MRRYPGEVWFLPPDAEGGGDFKGRRHVLLTSCEDTDDIGTFAYASTQDLEKRFGATWLRVDPAASRYPNTGFSQSTFIYPSRLVPAVSEDFQRMTGRLIDEMPELRRRLQEALGFRTGTAGRLGATRRSWRGRVIEFGIRRQQKIGYERGIVLTEHGYSARKRYQIVVPIDDLRAFEAEGEDVEITDADWFRRIVPSSPGVLVAIPDIQSVFHPRDVARWTGVTVDDTTIERMEAALARLFSL